MDGIALAIGIVLIVIIGIFGLVINWLMISGKINLEKLICEKNGDASMSRFQLLIFTFVIAMSLFLIVISKGSPGFPEIPNGIFVLLGISGGSYLISKGVQKASENNAQ